MKSINKYDIIKIVTKCGYKNQKEMILLKEEWRNLEFMGYPNYEVSNLGEVYSLNHGFISENRINKQGYRRVRLYANGKKKEMLVHRLVAFAFVDNPNKEEWNIVNHKDENKLNNRFDNLEWCTNEYNLTYGTAIQRRVETKFKNGTWNCDELKEINRKPVFKYDFNGSIIEKFISQTDCYAKDRVNSQILSSDVPMRRGYVYSYRDDITVDDILHMVEIVKKSYDDKMIKAYQYDYDCNLVAIHDDINKLDYNIYTIKECIENERKFYNKYIWSSFELDEEELRGRVADIMKYEEIYSYDINTLELKKYDNIDRIDEPFNKNMVRNCCNGVNLTHAGYIWSYIELKDNELSDIQDRIFIGSRKKVYQYNLLGEFIKEWNCIEDCIRGGYEKTSLHGCFKGILYQHNGYIWSKFELSQEELEIKIEAAINNTRVRPVYQYTKDLDLVKAWNTTSDANKAGFPTSPVSECCRGIRKSYKGYIWSYRKIK